MHPVNALVVCEVARGALTRWLARHPGGRFTDPARLTAAAQALAHQLVAEAEAAQGSGDDAGTGEGHSGNEKRTASAQEAGDGAA